MLKKKKQYKTLGAKAKKHCLTLIRLSAFMPITWGFDWGVLQEERKGNY